MIEKLNIEILKKKINNKNILITGGTGSFGNHFVETIIKNNLKPETKSSNNLQSVIESKSDQLAQNIFTPPTTQSNNVNLLPIPITQQQSQPINGNVPVTAPQVIPQVSTTPVTSTMSTVSFINMISNKQLSVG